MAKRLPNRLGHHLKDKHRRKWDGFSFYRIGKKKYIKDIETILIRVLKPRGNSVKGHFGSTSNVSSRLREEIQIWVDQQLKEL